MSLLPGCARLEIGCSCRSSQERVLPLLRTEQYHNEKSSYYYKPEKNHVRDGIGLVWSFARPSDDQTEFGYKLNS